MTPSFRDLQNKLTKADYNSNRENINSLNTKN